MLKGLREAGYPLRDDAPPLWSHKVRFQMETQHGDIPCAVFIDGEENDPFVSLHVGDVLTTVKDRPDGNKIHQEMKKVCGPVEKKIGKDIFGGQKASEKYFRSIETEIRRAVDCYMRLTQ